MSHVLIIDDEPSICWGFQEFLGDEGHDVSIAGSAEEAFRLVESKQPDAVVIDVRLPGMDGLSAIKELRKRLDDVPIIVITAFGNLETAVRAVKEGAFDYLPKPFDIDRAADLVQRALQSRLSRTTDDSRQRQPAQSDQCLVGSSPAMQEIFKQIALVAASDVPVLITGESGTGKELVARAIHQNSDRRDSPLIPVCLAALSSGIVESELFGHTKGAFTGAEVDRKGILELAAGGTVLLDEIADTTPALQVKLLRAIEQKEITPVGDARPRTTNVRIIAATNRSIQELIAAGEFRDDLYFRLSVFEIHLPPLRERLEDIPALAEHFLRGCVSGDVDCRLEEEVIAELQLRTWQGNVRELRNVLEHAAIVARGDRIRIEHLRQPAGETRTSPANFSNELQEQIRRWAEAESAATSDEDDKGELFERFLNKTEPTLLRTVLEHCNNNRAAAAQLLGIHRTTLREKLRKYGIG